jgi:hypothetical protein
MKAGRMAKDGSRCTRDRQTRVGPSAHCEDQTNIVRNRIQERAGALSVALCQRCVDIPP